MICEIDGWVLVGVQFASAGAGAVLRGMVTARCVFFCEMDGGAWVPADSQMCFCENIGRVLGGMILVQVLFWDAVWGAV